MKNEIFIKVNSIGKKDWNEFVYKNEFGNIFQTYEISEVYEKSKENEPLMLAAINENTDEILATMLIRKRKEKQGFLSSFSSHSTVRGGPIFVDNEWGIVAVEQLLRYYDKLVRKEALYTRIYPVYDMPQIKACLNENGYKRENWGNILIDLTKSVDELWKQLKKKDDMVLIELEEEVWRLRKLTTKGLYQCFIICY